MTTTLLRVATTAGMLTLMANAGLSAENPATNSGEHRFTYAVPIKCGFGQTNINIHNPGGRTVTFTGRGIPLEVGLVPTPPNDKQQMSLKPGWALLLGCGEILALGGVGPFDLGNVIIDSANELDVWAVYVDFVAGGGVGGTRMERIVATTSKK